MSRAAALVLLFALAGPALAASGPGEPEAGASSGAKPGCELPAEFTDPEDSLAHTAEALRAGQPVEILAIGSATLLGPEGEPAEASFPYRMREALLAAEPKAEIHLTVRGGKGMTAAEMLEVMREEFARRPVTLVVWQTGTVEAVRNVPPGDFAETLAEGAALAREHGADVILVDPQFSRFLRANANLEPYEEAIRQTAALPQVAVLRRFDLMRFWAEEGVLDLERAPRAERRRLAERLHACIGEALARLVLRGVGAGPAR